MEEAFQAIGTALCGFLLLSRPVRNFVAIAGLLSMDLTMPETTLEAPAVPSIPPASSHDRILFAGKRLFARNGYENTSTVAIAREAGTSESQLMKHFGSKQGLLAAVLDHGWAKIVRRVDASQNAASAAGRLIAALEAVVIELENDSELKELITLEGCRVRKDNHDVRMSGGYLQFSELIGSLLNQMRSQGQVRADINLDALRAGLIGMTEGLLRSKVVAGRSESSVDYSFDDMRKVLEAIAPAMGSEDEQRLRVVNG
jgi:AcrR family transcriptional regulator